VSVTYAEVIEEILTPPPPPSRLEVLLKESDRLLWIVEEMKLREQFFVPWSITERILKLAATAQLTIRRPRKAQVALDRIFDIQNVLLHGRLAEPEEQEEDVDG